MTADGFKSTVHMVEIGAIGTRVPLANLGDPQGPALSYAVTEDIPPFTLTKPVYLNRAEFAATFPAGAVRRNGKLACSVRNAFMFSPFGAIVLPDGSVVRESLLNADASALSFTYAQFKGQFPGRHIMWMTAERPVLSLNTYSTNNYFHFLIDALAQLHWTDRLPMTATMPMILSGYHPDVAKLLPFIAAATTRAGIHDSALVPFDGTMMLCRQVVFPARDTGANPTKVAELRQRLRVPESARGTARLYITRPGAGRRRLLNDAAIAARLAKRGFVAVDPGTLTFDQQIEIFASAEIVVGAHGAALTNGIFMPPGGALVELTHTRRVVWTFHEVACANRLAYACVIGTPDAQAESALFADFSVDPDEVDAAVDAALEAIRQ